jgi:hypothetical protein
LCGNSLVSAVPASKARGRSGSRQSAFAASARPRGLGRASGAVRARSAGAARPAAPAATNVPRPTAREEALLRELGEHLLDQPTRDAVVGCRLAARWQTVARRERAFEHGPAQRGVHVASAWPRDDERRQQDSPWAAHANLLWNGPF